MSGQGSSPDDEIRSNSTRGGESMRESSSRNGSSSNSNSANNNNNNASSSSSSAAHLHHQASHPTNNLHAIQHSMMNNNINYDNHVVARDVNMNDNSTNNHNHGSAGISSSGSSRSTARFAAANAAGAGDANNGRLIMMQQPQQQNQQGVTSTGSGSSQDVIMHNNASIHNDLHYNNPNNNLYHRQPQQQQYYSSSAGAPSSQAAASSMSTSHNTHHNLLTADINPNNTHYSQYSSITYPGELTVYSWGRGEDGQLGIGDTSDQDEPTYVDALRGVGVKQIACGSGHTVVLTGEGEVYTWGRGDDGRLGHGDNGWKYVPRLTHSLTGQIITHVTCGSYHTAAVSSNGDLYTWGGGMYGKLGHGSESGHSTPRRVEALVGLSVIDIACGSRHTAVVTNKGCLYTWGDKENGVAGHGDTEGHQYTPKLLERLSGKKVVQLSACGFHTGCLTDQGECFTWGEGKFGRLGHGAERNCHSPRLIETLLGKRPKQIACGGFHSAVVTEDGKMYTFGGGEHGQLGHGDKVNKVKPTLVQALDGIVLQQITCGWSHSVALTTNGEVFTWGNGDHGKLGHGNGKKVSTPQLVERLVGHLVVRVASYNEHTAALVEPQSIADGGSRRRAPGTMVPVSACYLHDMKEMVNDEEYSDVTFIVEGQPIYALRAVLAKRCEHFAAMFRSGMRESEAGVEIPIPTISRAVFLLILEYLYTDSVKIDLDHAVELYIASDLYQISSLRDMCCVIVRRSIGAENATYLLQGAHEAHCHVIKEIAMEYIVANFDVISKGEGIKAVSHGLLLEILSLRP
mmetsp:Transcript_29544/g.44482  ORF Transcript_29544/g.44482 Transcript_29544/m.44482 type:complete len:799 (-) Transcript_29544:62-2458(-)